MSLHAFELFPTLYLHKDLTTSRILKNEEDIKLIMDVAQTLFVHPFSHNDLICISNGLVATEDVKKDLITAEQKGKQAMKDFVVLRRTGILYHNQEDEAKDIQQFKEDSEE